MTKPELTEDAIAEGLARAEKVACRPSDDRCYAYADPLEIARASCSAQRAPEGAVSHRVDRGQQRRDSWDV